MEKTTLSPTEMKFTMNDSTLTEEKFLEDVDGAVNSTVKFVKNDKVKEGTDDTWLRALEGTVVEEVAPLAFEDPVRRAEIFEDAAYRVSRMSIGTVNRKISEHQKELKELELMKKSLEENTEEEKFPDVAIQQPPGRYNNSRKDLPELVRLLHDVGVQDKLLTFLSKDHRLTCMCENCIHTDPRGVRFERSYQLFRHLREKKDLFWPTDIERFESWATTKMRELSTGSGRKKYMCLVKKNKFFGSREEAKKRLKKKIYFPDKSWNLHSICMIRKTIEKARVEGRFEDKNKD